MRTCNNYIKRVFEHTKEIGCEYVEIVHIKQEKTQFNILNGEIDNHIIASIEGISLSVKWKTKTGYAYTERFENPEELVMHAIDNAKYNEQDEEVTRGNCVYIQKMRYCKLVDMSSSCKVALAKDLEEAVYSKGIPDLKVISTLYNTKKNIVSIYNSKGMNLKQIYNTGYLSINVLMEKEGRKYPGLSYISCNDQIDINSCAEGVINKVYARIESISPKSGIYNIIIKNDIMTKLLQQISPIFSAERAYNGLSTLINKEGTIIASHLLTIIDNPLMTNNYRKYDEEGTPSIKKDVIKNGKLITLLYDVKMGIKMGKKSTSNGYCAGDGTAISIYPTNMYIKNGKTSFEELKRMVDEVIVITEVSGLNSGLNTTSGDFSLPAKGILITKNKNTPIEQFIISGNIYELFKSVIAVGNDIYFGIPTKSIFGSPSILFNEFLISGKG